MAKPAPSRRRRVNVMLSEETLRLLDRAVSKGDRSRLIDEAVVDYVTSKRRSTVRFLLKEGAIARADRDRELAEDWFALEEEPWLRRNR